jgi:Mrp family chromosome partitioning ATPase
VRNLLAKSNVNIIGVIINKLREQAFSYGYGYGKSYRYYGGGKSYGDSGAGETEGRASAG